MAVEKTVLGAILSQLQRGGVRLTYWDGEMRTYGPEKPYFHLTIKTPRVVRAMAKNISLGFGESYMNGLIEIDGPLDHIVRLQAENKQMLPQLPNLFRYRTSSAKHQQRANIHHHYDLGNDFYKLWLDKAMAYSCAYFRAPHDSLETAQSQKVDHILKRLLLKKGQRLLDIGSGWGTLLFRAVESYGVTGHGITLSEEQYAYCLAETKRRKLGKKLTFELLNYQDLAQRGERFDRIVSVGMFEHVGRNQQKQYLKAVHDMLAEGGISVLHTITGAFDKPNDAWIDKYIFPGGHLPTIQTILAAFPDYSFRLLDYESLKYHYAMTLDEWWRRFEKHKTKVIQMYDERFYRMWRFWLASSSASFRYGDLDLSQFVFIKGNGDAPLTREHLYVK